MKKIDDEALDMLTVFCQTRNLRYLETSIILRIVKFAESRDYEILKEAADIMDELVAVESVEREDLHRDDSDQPCDVTGMTDQASEYVLSLGIYLGAVVTLRSMMPPDSSIDMASVPKAVVVGFMADRTVVLSEYLNGRKSWLVNDLWAI